MSYQSNKKEHNTTTETEKNTVGLTELNSLFGSLKNFYLSVL